MRLALLDRVDLFVSANLGQVIFALAVAMLVLFSCGAALTGIIFSLKKRYRKLMRGHSGIDLEEMLKHFGDRLDGCLERQDRIELRVKAAEQNLQFSLAGVGLVRYNAFQDTGSDLSFSLALLDRNLDGVVITSIFGRDESRCYGKPVVRGASSHFLSEEEQQALNAAQKNLQARKKERKRNVK
jgi:hypothetical protein